MPQTGTKLPSPNPTTDAALASIDAKIAALKALRVSVASCAWPRAGFSINVAVAAILGLKCTGARVIVTGLGKSGHVARKIAATLQSTGQPAAFLHPAEAAHGDMGIIRDGDLILALSNSGETDELARVLDYAQDRYVPCFVITSNPAGALARRADGVIITPALPEGDPIGLAPMASTCAQLAVGDAIAAALMSRRGFTPADFARYHHGGYLGRKAKGEEN